MYAYVNSEVQSTISTVYVPSEIHLHGSNIEYILQRKNIIFGNVLPLDSLGKQVYCPWGKTKMLVAKTCQHYLGTTPTEDQMAPVIWYKV